MVHNSIPESMKVVLHLQAIFFLFLHLSFLLTVGSKICVRKHLISEGKRGGGVVVADTAVQRLRAASCN